MEENFFLKNEFKSYLEDSSMRSKPSDYLNYVSNAHKIYGEDLRTQIEGAYDELDIERLDNVRMDAYNKIQSSSKPSKSKYISGLNKYLDFIIEEISMKIQSDNIVDDLGLIFDSDETEIYIEPNITANDNIKEFDDEKIRTIFYLRLITQNRFNKCGLFYPISFLKQFFYKMDEKVYFDNLINKEIDKISYLTENKTFNIKGISSIAINDDGEVLIGDELVYSFNFEKNAKEKLIVEKFSQIVIDHTVSMNEILNSLNAENKLPIIEYISKELRKGLHKPVTYKKQIARGTKLSKDQTFLNKINKDELKKEFEYILNKMELQLMFHKHNNFKRAK